MESDQDVQTCDQITLIDHLRTVQEICCVPSRAAKLGTDVRKQKVSQTHFTYRQILGITYIICVKNAHKIRFTVNVCPPKLLNRKALLLQLSKAGRGLLQELHVQCLIHGYRDRLKFETIRDLNRILAREYGWQPVRIVQLQR